MKFDVNNFFNLESLKLIYMCRHFDCGVSTM